MNYDNASSSGWARVSPLALAFLVLPLFACMEPASLNCKTGLVCPAGYQCAEKGNVCIKNSCGDGVVQSLEACDDGDIEDGDGCSANCLSTETCGNGVVDAKVYEVCDTADPETQDGCASNCRSKQGCQNGVIDPGEECDDKNPSSEDDCLSMCRLARCGDGFVDRQGPEIEACDPGDGSRDCNHNCTESSCGDGVVNPFAGEHCDPGEAGQTDSCNANCTVARCGDGIINAQAGEDCDERGERTATCELSCKKAWCGDGIVNPEAGEECDDGRDGNGNNCLDNCKLARCGDGHLDKQEPFVEACDDGNALACGTCNAACTVAQPLAPATGVIVATGGVNIKHGETFSISDGPDAKNRLKFTFDRDNQYFGLLAIHVTDDDDAADVARMIENAIHNNGLDFDHKRQGAVIKLENSSFKKGLGNQLITENVSFEGFWVMGMENGAGHDCPIGTGCTSGNDCASGTCSKGRCQ
jgi:cysteine-rich repeat protein